MNSFGWNYPGPLTSRIPLLLFEPCHYRMQDHIPVAESRAVLEEEVGLLLRGRSIRLVEQRQGRTVAVALVEHRYTHWMVGLIAADRIVVADRMVAVGRMVLVAAEVARL